MAVDHDELAAVGGGVAHDREAAVEVEVLRREGLVDRVAAADGLGGLAGGEREQAGVHAAVEVGDGVGQEGGVEVRGEVGGVPGEGLLEGGPLVHVVAAVRVHVHLLEQHEVRPLPVAQPDDGPDGARRGLLDGFARDGGAALARGGGAVSRGARVHEEGELGGVCPEAHVVGDGRELLAHGDGLACGLRPARLEGDAVLDAVVGELEVRGVPRDDGGGERDDERDAPQDAPGDDGHGGPLPLGATILLSARRRPQRPRGPRPRALLGWGV